jgi:hypothetical protein
VNASNSQFAENLMPVAQEQARRWDSSCGVLVVMGLSIYVISVFLWAGDFGDLVGPLRGYFCAEISLVSSFSEDGRSVLRERPIEYFSLLVSGLINPVFLVTFFLQIFRARSRALVVLRSLTILMIPLCWVVFRYERLHPREGHFFWIFGMILTLFTMSNLRIKRPKRQHA